MQHPLDARAAPEVHARLGQGERAVLRYHLIPKAYTGQVSNGFEASSGDALVYFLVGIRVRWGGE